MKGRAALSAAFVGRSFVEKAREALSWCGCGAAGGQGSGHLFLPLFPGSSGVPCLLTGGTEVLTS